MHRVVCGEWWAYRSQETLYEIPPALTVFHDTKVFAKEICLNLQQSTATGGYCVCSKQKLPRSSFGSAAPSWGFGANEPTWLCLSALIYRRTMVAVHQFSVCEWLRRAHGTEWALFKSVLLLSIWTMEERFTLEYTVAETMENLKLYTPGFRI